MLTAVVHVGDVSGRDTLEEKGAGEGEKGGGARRPWLPRFLFVIERSREYLRGKEC